MPPPDGLSIVEVLVPSSIAIIDISDPDTSTTVLVEVPSAISLVEVDIPGIQGPGGVAGADTLIFDQGSASSLWHIVHNLNRFPSITIVDSAGDQVVGDVDYVDSNVIDVMFTAPFAGKAYIN